MSVQYGAIGWNRQKKIYDSVVVSLVVLYRRRTLSAWGFGETRPLQRRRC